MNKLVSVTDFTIFAVLAIYRTIFSCHIMTNDALNSSGVVISW